MSASLTMYLGKEDRPAPIVMSSRKHSEFPEPAVHVTVSDREDNEFTAWFVGERGITALDQLIEEANKARRLLCIAVPPQYVSSLTVNALAS